MSNAISPASWHSCSVGNRSKAKNGCPLNNPTTTRSHFIPAPRERRGTEPAPACRTGRHGSADQDCDGYVCRCMGSALWSEQRTSRHLAAQPPLGRSACSPSLSNIESHTSGLAQGAASAAPQLLWLRSAQQCRLQTPQGGAFQRRSSCSSSN